MAKLTTEQYLLLSKVAYSDFSQVNTSDRNKQNTTLDHLSTLKTTNYNPFKLRNETTSVLAGYKNYTTNEESIVYKTGALESLQNWRLLDFEQKGAFDWKAASNAAVSATMRADLPAVIPAAITAGVVGGTGFSGSAFAEYDGDDVKNLVISFRGTEPNPLDPIDLFEDAGFISGLSLRQYGDAYRFMLRSVRNAFGGGRRMSDYEAQQLFVKYADKITFTGHSLGGGLAQYATYMTRRWGAGSGIYTETFNAVAAGQTFNGDLLEQIFDANIRRKLDLRGPGYEYLDTPKQYVYDSYNVVDHVNSSDTIGNYKNEHQLGKTVVHIDDANVDPNYVDTDVLARMRNNLAKNLIGKMTDSELEASNLELLNSIRSRSYDHDTPAMMIIENTAKLYNGYKFSISNQKDDLTKYHGLEGLIDTYTGKMTSVANHGLEAFMQVTYADQINKLFYLKRLEDMDLYDSRTCSNPVSIDVFIAAIHRNDYQYSDEYKMLFGAPLNNGIDPSDKALYGLYLTQFKDALAVAYGYDRIGQNEEMQGYLERYAQAAAAENRRIDPLVFDLNGDGVSTVSERDSTAYFDLDNNGFAEKTGWINSEDGFLVLDKNKNGTIDNSNELFGDRTTRSDGSIASSGFAALSDYDSNGDFAINAFDDIFPLLRVWVDANSDGVSQSAELFTLQSLGIRSIALTSHKVGREDNNGNIIVRQGSFETNNGEQDVYEFLFSRQASSSLEREIRYVEEQFNVVASLPGSGNVPSLQNALANADNTQLHSLVLDVVNEADRSKRYDIFESMMQEWFGVAAIAPESRGGVFDARKMAALEAFFGMNYNANGGNPTNRSAGILENLYADLRDNLYATFTSKVHFREIVDLIEDDSIQTGKSIVAYIKDQLLNDRQKALSMLYDFGLYVRTKGIEDKVDFSSIRQTLFGTGDVDVVRQFAGYFFGGSDANGDVLVGTSGDDTLSIRRNTGFVVGMEGGDTITVNQGVGIIMAGAGDDMIRAEAGNTEYIFNKNDGHDLITDLDTSKNNQDVIVFGQGITPDTVRVTRTGRYDMHITFLDSPNDSITVKHYFGSYSQWSYGTSYRNAYVIEQLRFSDGTIWDEMVLREKANHLYGTAQDDRLIAYNSQWSYLHGYDGNDILSLQRSAGGIIDAGPGDDTLSTSTYKDGSILIGGIGNDRMYGSYGSDTYIYNLGDGDDYIRDYNKDPNSGKVDTLRLGAGISVDNVRIERENERITLYIDNDQGEQMGSIILDSYFTHRISYYGDQESAIENIEFHDGTVWHMADVEDRLRHTYGTDGDDVLRGYRYKPSVLYGYGGNDTLEVGPQGGEAYGGRGDDTIGDGMGFYTHNLFVGGKGDDMLYGGVGEHTYRYAQGDGHDVILDNDDYINGREDTLVFSHGITPSDVRIERLNDSDIIVRLRDGSGSVTLRKQALRYGQRRGYGVERILFLEDNTVLDRSAIREQASYIYGTENDDTLKGYFGQYNRIYGHEGNDTIAVHGVSAEAYGGAGDDTILMAGNSVQRFILDGGTGNDLLFGRGESANHIYRYELGYGLDTILDKGGDNDILQFGQGIHAHQLMFERLENDVFISNVATKQYMIKLQDFFYSSSYWIESGNDRYMVDKLLFAGSERVLTKQDIADATSVLFGTQGKDTLSAPSTTGKIFAGAGDDVITTRSDTTVFAGGGDDTIHAAYRARVVAGAGDDSIYSRSYGYIHYYALGDGHDTVTGRVSNLAFDKAITPDDVSVQATGLLSRNLTIFVRGEKALTLKNYTRDSLNYVAFSDGTLIQRHEIEAKYTNTKYSKQIIGIASHLPTNTEHQTPTYYDRYGFSNYAMTSARVDQLVDAMAAYKDGQGVEGLQAFNDTKKYTDSDVSLWML